MPIDDGCEGGLTIQFGLSATSLGSVNPGRSAGVQQLGVPLRQQRSFRARPLPGTSLAFGEGIRLLGSKCRAIYNRRL